MPMSRNKKLAVRNALGAIYNAIPQADRSKGVERERDLICVANLAVWDGDIKKIHRCVRRLLGSAERGPEYAKVMALLA